MMTSPIVSVILTAHNYGRYLAQSVESVLAQTFENWELVAVNDGSTDDTAAILERYAKDPRVTVVTLPSVGLAAACNAGIRRSKGSFVLRLDADDFLDPHALLVMVEVLTSRPEIGLVYPDYYKVDEESRFLEYVRVPRVQEGARLLDHNPLAGGALYRRFCYDVIGGYNETLRYQEDYDFWLRFTERFQVYGVGLPLLSYRQHAGSMSKNRISRSAARRYVKREYTATRHLETGRDALIVIPEIWPGAPARSQDLLRRPLGATTPMRLALEQAQACEGSKGVVVITEHSETRRIAEVMGVEAMAVPNLPPTGFERSDLAWLRGFVQTLAASRRSVPDLLILSSPYCPLRHPERLREVIDTMLIHDCDLVLSVDSESITPWAVGPAGLQTVQPDGLSGVTRMVREGGELLAIRARWLNEPRPLAESLVGYVELLFPEGWCVTDDATFRRCQDLLSWAESLIVQSTTYLRT